MWSLVKWWNRTANFRPLLQSRLILYFLFLLCLMTLYGYKKTPLQKALYG